MPNKLINTYRTSYPLKLADKYRIICKVLEFRSAISWFDDKDLTYFVKVLLENGIVLISEEAYRQSHGGKDLWKKKTPSQWSDYVSRMLKGVPQTDYLQEKIDRNKYSWEHIVPAKVLIDEVKSLYASKKFTQKTLSSIIEKYGAVCIVSKSENDTLTKNKLRSKMPTSWKFGDPELCRYNSVGISLKQP